MKEMTQFTIWFVVYTALLAMAWGVDKAWGLPEWTKWSPW